MYAGTVVTICGVVLTVLSASVVGTLEADFQDLLSLWVEVGWLLYISFTICLGFILQATHQVYILSFGASLCLTSTIVCDLVVFKGEGTRLPTCLYRIRASCDLRNLLCAIWHLVSRLC